MQKKFHENLHGKQCHPGFKYPLGLALGLHMKERKSEEKIYSRSEALSAGGVLKIRRIPAKEREREKGYEQHTLLSPRQYSSLGVEICSGTPSVT
jgi:hypothetical protein